MALEIAPTPTLKGEEADWFIKNMEQVAKKAIVPNPDIDKIIKAAILESEQESQD